MFILTVHLNFLALAPVIFSHLVLSVRLDLDYEKITARTSVKKKCHSISA